MKKQSLFKLFLSDVGLLTTMYGKATKFKVISKDKDINFGSVFENFTAQELIAHGFKGYYYQSKKYGELDFVIESNGEVLPIEIKSGKDYEKRSALNNVMKLPNYNIKQSFVFTDYNVLVKDNIIYYPIYMLMFLLNDDFEIKIPDFRSLSF